MNLHELGNRTISIEQIGKLPMSVLWTLSNEWRYTGRTCSDGNSQVQSFFGRLARCWTQRLKKQYLKTPFVIVKSRKLVSEAQKSSMMRRLNMTVLPNPVDTHFGKPAIGKHLDPSLIRVGFSFNGWKAGRRKGADLVPELIQRWVSAVNNNVPTSTVKIHFLRTHH